MTQDAAKQETGNKHGRTMPTPPKETRWKKGQSGNPKGRPKGAKGRAATIKKWLYTEMEAQNPITKQKETMNQEDVAVLALIKQAHAGNVHAFRELMDSVYGKLKENIELDHGPQDVQIRSVAVLRPAPAKRKKSKKS